MVTRGLDAHALVLMVLLATTLAGCGTPAAIPSAATVPSVPPSSAPSPVPTPSPMPTTAPTPAASVEPVLRGRLAPGTYAVPAPFPVEMSLTVGEGWQMWTPIVSAGGFWMYNRSRNMPDGMGLVVGIANNVYADACDRGKGFRAPPLGPTVDDFVTAILEQPLTAASTPVPVTLDGWDGTYLEYEMTHAQLPCLDLGRWTSSQGTREAIPGEHDRVWVVDVDGVRLVIDAFHFPSTSDADLAALMALVESMDITGLRAPASSPSPAS